MALDCRSPIDFGPSASSPSARPSVHYDDDDDAVLLSFISGRSRPSVRPSSRCSVLGSGFGLEDTSGFRLSSLSFPPSLSISPF